MASPSPFQMEDQTDEDFFDKLVDNEFGVSESGPSFEDVVDSDEANAFSNLSIDEVVGTVSKGENLSEEVKFPSLSEIAAEKDILIPDQSNISLISSNAFNADQTAESGVNGANVASDNGMSKSSGSRNTSIKEVQWSSFSATDSSQHSELRSYLDFFTELDGNSADPFANVGDVPELKPSSSTEDVVADSTASFGSAQHKVGQAYEAVTEDTADGQNWESLYPGWRYDTKTGEWQQVDGYDASANSYQGSFEGEVQAAGDNFVSDQRSEVSYLQQTVQSVTGTVSDNCTTSRVYNWNQVSHLNNTEYPEPMVFDPQYPGWYYDTITQEWRLLESNNQAVQSNGTSHDQQIQNGNASTGGFYPEKDHSLYGEYGESKNYGSQGHGGQIHGEDWAGHGSANNTSKQNMNMWQPATVATESMASFCTKSQKSEKFYGSQGSVSNYSDQHNGTIMGTASLYEQTSRGYDDSRNLIGFQSFVPALNESQQRNQPKVEQSQQMQFSHSLQTSSQFSFASSEARSSAGRPPHALVTFGFGGKLIVMNDCSSFVTNSAYASQDSVGSSISILNLMDIVVDKSNSSIGVDYFHTLCQQSFPGPLVGGNFGNKELYKWIDERISNCESSNMDYRKRELLRLLLSLLKIACRHCGKLRSPFGTDPSLKEGDCPESAVAKLFASAERNGAQLSGYGAITQCLQNLPSEGQIRATAAEVQNLLVSGCTKEALQCAQEGQLWGPALVLAAQLGNQFHVDTVKQMAHHQLVAGSPLRTLCLLIAGQPADVFSADSTNISGVPGAVNLSQQPAQIGSNCMLDDWEKNLAVITANRTKNDELVIIHLGDCLWKERGEITAAHTCYLVAEANIESYSDSARMCLIGADHWKFPRTYASPDAIQRTELYEYAKVLGNSQSVMLPFQPYKLIYAYMLAELGKISDSLKYSQSILKSIKTGRAPEVEMWKQLTMSLEERIRTYQQGGYCTNLAPAKLVGKLLPLIDRSIHRMIGTQPPPSTSVFQSTVQGNEYDKLPAGPRVANSQSTMAMSSLMPSESMEPISGWTAGSNRMGMHNRSISEPDFGRSSRQVDPSTEASSDAQGKASVSGGPSRFGRFSSQLLQKTMGWVSRSRPDRQAKLGEKNKFYYDEKLKQWIEEGAEPPAQERALPPPPTTAFQNGTPDYNIKNTLKSESLPANGGSEFRSPSPSEHSSGIPPIPPSSNHFSARGRMGVRSRYVDTFNKSGGAPTNLFQTPSVLAAKPATGTNAKFFIPTPATSGDQTVDNATEENIQEATGSPNEGPPISSTAQNSIFSTPSLSSSMQRAPSMNSITPMGSKGMGVMGNGALSSGSRRTASWSGSVIDTFNSPSILSGTMRNPHSSFMHVDSMGPPTRGSSFGELHEVEL
ncbi:Sec16 [Macleaya cordata]|uniref:Protein transport protein sec16 n=1 Tax=Macleaya cordata TaxID=56857 RepID=A0A200Q2W2_MACCD|nr:Sec16 [Macleaya cordata]